MPCLEAALAGEDDAGTPSPDDSPRRATAAPPENEDGGRADHPSGIGSEQVRTRNRTGADLAAAHGLRVAGYATVPYRRLQIELENGQVWRQIAGDTQRVSVNLERNRTVDIEESGLGGYKLRLNEIGRTIRAERIR